MISFRKGKSVAAPIELSNYGRIDLSKSKNKSDDWDFDDLLLDMDYKAVPKSKLGSYAGVDLSDKSVSELNVIAFKIIKEREELKKYKNAVHNFVNDLDIDDDIYFDDIIDPASLPF